MFTSFTKEQKAIHFPSDRRMFIAVKPYMLVTVAIGIVLPIAAAWLQYLIAGLPADPGLIPFLITPASPTGFPMWVNLSHWVNFFFLILIIRSGLSILVDHPRLYWNSGCKPGTEWIRFTPLKIPKNKSWTAKEDAHYISPILGLPGYKHTIGIARAWHFVTVPFFILNGVVLLSCCLLPINGFG